MQSIYHSDSDWTHSSASITITELAAQEYTKGLMTPQGLHALMRMYVCAALWVILDKVHC